MGNYTHGALTSMTAEYEVSEILEHFNSQYVFDVIQDKINNRFTPVLVMGSSDPNIVVSFEDNFKRCIATYPDDIQNIKSVREETYNEIIDIIAKNYNFRFKYIDGVEGYTYAYYLYDFFVCNFSKYIAKFFAKYIFDNKDNLYNALGLEAYKKNKDGATAYGKRVYEDNKLAVISANIVFVVNAIRTFDITPQIIFSSIYGTQEIVNLLSACIEFPYDIFKVLFYSATPDYEPILFTDIRLELQQLAQRSDPKDYV